MMLAAQVCMKDRCIFLAVQFALRFLAESLLLAIRRSDPFPFDKMCGRSDVKAGYEDFPAAVVSRGIKLFRISNAPRCSPSCLNRLMGPSSVQIVTAALCLVASRSDVTSWRINSNPSICWIALKSHVLL